MSLFASLSERETHGELSLNKTTKQTKLIYDGRNQDRIHHWVRYFQAYSRDGLTSTCNSVVTVMQSFSSWHDSSICKMGTTQPDGRDGCIPTKASCSQNLNFRNNFFLDEGGGEEKGVTCFKLTVIFS